jgi:hypothetical protein
MRAGAFFMSKHRLTLATLVALLAVGALLVAHHLDGQCRRPGGL